MNEVVVMKADWCGPCKSYETVLQAVEATNGVEILRLDIDSEAFKDWQATTTGAVTVMSVPITVVTRHGEVVARKDGVMTPHQLQSWLADNNVRGI